MKNKRILQIGLVAAVVLVTLFVFTLLTDDTRGYQRVDTSVAMQQMSAGNVAEAQIDDREQRVRLELREPITVEEREGVEQIMTQYPARTAPQIFDAVQTSGADSYTTEVTQDSFLMGMLGFLLPMLLLFGLLFFFLTRMQTGGGLFGFGGSKAKELTRDMPTNTFADVAGADEAVAELHEIKDFLEDPSRYYELGAKIPRGVLLYGPPGTGKTLLARAVAGEAGVPFYSISGSDFVEMFVGVGASRVRDLFKQARESSPCIIFVDEIDAVGRQRGSGTGGGHDEREQTLNQLLVEMDGFGDREGVILMAATNRPDILDPALLRPGRFDRQIPVTNPDLAGRAQILKVHAQGKPLGPDADLDALAKRTAGMSGADLANVLNEAALLTARIGGNVITADALEEATDRVIGGPRREGKIISEKEKKVTAYHEGGHTLAAWALKDIERVYKVTILARGRTGGHAMTVQEDDRGMYNRDELFARLVFAMGGRAAEELVFGEPTTGASADIEQATKIARAMVTEYGMSPTVGTVKYGIEQGDPFARSAGGGSLDYSPEVAAQIDREVRHLLDTAHRLAYEVLREYRDHLDQLAAELLEKETLRRPDLEVLFQDIVPREIEEVFPGEGAHYPHQVDRDPVKTPVELAIERGEEPPKRFSLLEATREARSRRQAELAAQRAGHSPVAPAQGPDEQSPETPAGVGAGSAQGGGEPRYAGTPPPPGWTVPGRPPTENPYAAPEAPVGVDEHPGMRNYGSGESPVDAGSTRADSDRPAPEKAPQHPAPATEVIGFRLPEYEQPVHHAQGESVPAGKIPEEESPAAPTQDRTAPLPVSSLSPAPTPSRNPEAEAPEVKAPEPQEKPEAETPKTDDPAPQVKPEQKKAPEKGRVSGSSAVLRSSDRKQADVSDDEASTEGTYSAQSEDLTGPMTISSPSPTSTPTPARKPEAEAPKGQQEQKKPEAKEAEPQKKAPKTGRFASPSAFLKRGDRKQADVSDDEASTEGTYRAPSEDLTGPIPRYRDADDTGARGSNDNDDEQQEERNER